MFDSFRPYSLPDSKIQEQQQGGVTDEAEPFMGSGRFGTKAIPYPHEYQSSPHLIFLLILHLFMYQLGLTYLDITVMMKKSLKLL